MGKQRIAIKTSKLGTFFVESYFSYNEAGYPNFIIGIENGQRRKIFATVCVAEAEPFPVGLHTDLYDTDGNMPVMSQEIDGQDIINFFEG